MSVRRQYKSRENTYLNATRCRSPPFLKMYSLRNQPFADSIYRPITTLQTLRTKHNKGVSDREKTIPDTARGQRVDTQQRCIRTEKTIPDTARRQRVDTQQSCIRTEKTIHDTPSAYILINYYRTLPSTSFRG